MNIQNYNFIKKIQKIPEVLEIILYGSRSRGTHKERSDIDIAINCPKLTEHLWIEILNIVHNNYETLLKIDCVRYDQLSDESPLKKIIDKEGKVIFKREIS